MGDGKIIIKNKDGLEVEINETSNEASLKFVQGLMSVLLGVNSEVKNYMEKPKKIKIDDGTNQSSDTDGDEEVSNKFSKADVDEVSVKNIVRTKRMPYCSSDFRCPSCGQGILALFTMKNSTEPVTLVRDARGESTTVYAIEADPTYKESITSKRTKTNIKKIIDIYNDFLESIEQPGCSTKQFLVQGSEDKCTCPMCNSVNLLDDWLKAFVKPEAYDFVSSNMCDICGNPSEIVVSGTGNKSCCKNNCESRVRCKK